VLGREQLLTAFQALSDELGRQGILGELNIVGGTAMVRALRGGRGP
jgi:hypothetical protein